MHIAEWSLKYKNKMDKKIDYVTKAPCHLWTGSTYSSKNKAGDTKPYGRFHFTDFESKAYTETTAHHAYYMFFNEVSSLKPPDGTDYPGPWDCSHTCHEKLCLNVSHISYEPHCINVQRNTCKNQTPPSCCSHHPYANCMF